VIIRVADKIGIRSIRVLNNPLSPAETELEIPNFAS
jgi:hypothetical protein